MSWRWIPSLGALCLLIVVGCRTTQPPDLKPPKEPETFNKPSENANLTGYPKQAFATGDDSHRGGGGGPGGMGGGMGAPANFGGPGMGGMGGGGMPGMPR